MDERTAALEQVNQALPVFEQINELYLTANSLNQRNLAIQDASARDLNGKRLIGMVAGGVMGFWVGVFLHLITSIVLNMFPPLIYLMGTFALMGICCLGGVCLGATVGQNLHSKTLADTDSRLTVIRAQIDQISQQIYQITVDNQVYIDPIPRDYRYYDAVAFFERALTNGRADSMKEAINLYEDHLHKQTMEAQGRMLLEQSRQQSAMLASIERSSRETAINTGIAASFTVANYFSHRG